MSEAAPRPPVIERVAALAMQLGSRHLADYGANTSRHDFTQRQLMACLILRAYLKTTYRGVLDFLAASQSVRQELGLQDCLPHYSTLAKFSARSQVVEIAQKLVGEIGQAAAAQAPHAPAAVMDATGLALNNASDYFCCAKANARCASGSKCRWSCSAAACCLWAWCWILAPARIASRRRLCWRRPKRWPARRGFTPTPATTPNGSTRTVASNGRWKA